MIKKILSTLLVSSALFVFAATGSMLKDQLSRLVIQQLMVVT